MTNIKYNISASSLTCYEIQILKMLNRLNHKNVIRLLYSYRTRYSDNVRLPTDGFTTAHQGYDTLHCYDVVATVYPQPFSRNCSHGSTLSNANAMIRYEILYYIVSTTDSIALKYVITTIHTRIRVYFRSASYAGS